MKARHKVILSYITWVILFAISLLAFYVLNDIGIGVIVMSASMLLPFLLNPVKRVGKDVWNTRAGKISYVLFGLGLFGYLILVISQFLRDEPFSHLVFRVLMFGLFVPAFLPLGILTISKQLEIASQIDIRDQQPYL